MDKNQYSKQIFGILFRQFQLFGEVEGIEMLKVSGDIVPGSG